jgi:hypothetical protein
MTSGDNIGMMEGAFFVSKGILISWINEFFCVSKTFLISLSATQIYIESTPETLFNPLLTHF